MINKDIQFMPFGSMMNSYGQINQGSKKPTADFLADVDKIYSKSLELVNKNQEKTGWDSSKFKQPKAPGGDLYSL